MKYFVRPRKLQHRDRLRLQDIRTAIEKIERFTNDQPDWVNDRGGLVWDAVLYNFAVIGEATKALSEETRNLAPDAEWSPAAKMRDFVIHQYSATDPLIVAGTVETDLPTLKAVVIDLLARLKAP